MKVPGIIRDDKTGSFSHTKFWANVGYLEMSWAFIHQVAKHGLDVALLGTFGLIFCGAHIATNYIGRRYGNPLSTNIPNPDGSQFNDSPLNGDTQ